MVAGAKAQKERCSHAKANRKKLSKIKIAIETGGEAKARIESEVVTEIEARTGIVTRIEIEVVTKIVGVISPMTEMVLKTEIDLRSRIASMIVLRAEIVLRIGITLKTEVAPKIWTGPKARTKIVKDPRIKAVARAEKRTGITARTVAVILAVTATDRFSKPKVARSESCDEANSEVNDPLKSQSYSLKRIQHQ